MASTGICCGCGTQVLPGTGKRVQALDAWWHGKCFKCDECRLPLVLDIFHHLDDGRKVCQACRNKILCVSCGHTVADERAYEVDGKLYHKECFRCHKCGVLLQGRFVDVKDEYFCGPCASGTATFEEGCPKCFRPITTSAIKACGSRWHEECFVCYQCDRPFPNDLFVNKDGKPYCDDCAASMKSASARGASSASASSRGVASTAGGVAAGAAASSGFAKTAGVGKGSVAPVGASSDAAAAQPRRGSGASASARAAPTLPARDRAPAPSSTFDDEETDQYGEPILPNSDYGREDDMPRKWKADNTYQGGKNELKLKDHVEQYNDMTDFAFSSNADKRKMGEDML